MPLTEELIGSVEAGRILGRSPRTIHRLVAAGDLVPAMTAPGGHNGVFLFRRDDIQALADRTAQKQSGGVMSTALQVAQGSIRLTDETPREVAP